MSAKTRYGIAGAGRISQLAFRPAVALPNAVRAVHAIRAARAGMYVLAEKPFATTEGNASR